MKKALAGIIIGLVCVVCIGLIVIGFIHFSDDPVEESLSPVIGYNEGVVIYQDGPDDYHSNGDVIIEDNRNPVYSGTSDTEIDYSRSPTQNPTIPVDPSHVHTWAEATCTAPKTCMVCYVTEGSPLGHYWEAATCTEPKTCYYCGLTEGGLADHSYVAATCTSAEYCDECGETFGSALGHNFSNGVCTVCSASDPNTPRFDIIDVPMSKGGCNITSVTTTVSGDTLYLTISGVRESGSGDVRLLLEVFSYGYTDHTASDIVYLTGISSGSTFSQTFALEGAIKPEYNRYEVWIS